jgi:uncharacterized membrane protein (UPF0127 family)
MDNPKLKFRVGTDTVYARVAYTINDKAQGYIGSNSISKDDGILFTRIHENDAFHMKNVKHALAIVFLDKSFNVLRVATMSPEQEHLTYAPENCEYALELSPELRDICLATKNMTPEFDLDLASDSRLSNIQ